MVELVKTIATSLVDHPELVEVTETGEKGDAVVIQLKVAEDDMGKVIGRQGRIAKALRTVVKAASLRLNKKVVVEIVS